MKSPSKMDQARAAREAEYERSRLKRVPDASSELMKALAILLPVKPAAVAEAPKPALKPKPIKAAPPALRRSQMYAPPGQCECCDRNRAKALDRVKRHRDKRK